MKKALLFLLLLTLIIIIPFHATADEVKSFKPSITNAINYSASTWFSDSEHRAILAVLLSFEYEQENPSFSPKSIVNNSTYIGITKDIDSLMILFTTDSGDAHMLVYSPSLKRAVYDVISNVTDLAIELYLDSKEACSLYYRIPSSDMLNAVTIIDEAVN